ncbi:MAG: ATP-binding protein [Planctomycetota bacterium]
MATSFRTRFQIVFSSLFTLLLGGFLALNLLSQHRRLHRDLRNDMEKESALIQSMLIEEVEEKGGADPAREDMEKILRGSRHPVRLISAGGAAYAEGGPSVPSFPTDAATLGRLAREEGEAWTSPNGTTYELFAAECRQAEHGWSGAIVMARSTDLIDNRIVKSLREGLFYLIGALFVSMVVGRVVAARAMGPIRLLTQVMNGITASTLDRRAGPVRGDPEIERLVESFHALLDRIADAHQRLHRYTADVSHEIQTPLAVLKGHLEVALREEGRDEAQHELLGLLLDEVESMQAIAQDLLYLARADAGSAPPGTEEVDLAEVVADAVEIGGHLGGARGIGVDLSREGGPWVVRGSRVQLLRALTNLVDNAVKYGRSRVVVRLSGGPGGCEVAVQDDGDGIQPADLPHVFERFYQADPSRDRQSRGVGLGLAVTQAILRAHGGTIALDSSPGKGTTARVQFGERPLVRN